MPPTSNQLRRGVRTPKIHWIRTYDLKKSPQRRATCFRIAIRTPRKPNSAKRKTMRVTITYHYRRRVWTRRVSAYIPGAGHNLHKYSKVLIRGGRRCDIPGMKYTAIRGKFDFEPLSTIRKARSKYGVKKG